LRLAKTFLPFAAFPAASVRAVRTAPSSYTTLEGRTSSAVANVANTVPTKQVIKKVLMTPPKWNLFSSKLPYWIIIL
jgi:hypothetical protein